MKVILLSEYTQVQLIIQNVIKSINIYHVNI